MYESVLFKRESRIRVEYVTVFFVYNARRSFWFNYTQTCTISHIRIDNCRESSALTHIYTHIQTHTQWHTQTHIQCHSNTMTATNKMTQTQIERPTHIMLKNLKDFSLS